MTRARSGELPPWAPACIELDQTTNAADLMLAR